MYAKYIQLKSTFENYISLNQISTPKPVGPICVYSQSLNPNHPGHGYYVIDCFYFCQNAGYMLEWEKEEDRARERMNKTTEKRKPMHLTCVTKCHRHYWRKLLASRNLSNYPELLYLFSTIAIDWNQLDGMACISHCGRVWRRVYVGQRRHQHIYIYILKQATSNVCLWRWK